MKIKRNLAAIWDKLFPYYDLERTDFIVHKVLIENRRKRKEEDG